MTELEYQEYIQHMHHAFCRAVILHAAISEGQKLCRRWRREFSLEYLMFENLHEPLIDTETWERVQELRKQRKRPNRNDEVGLFSGMLFCADCGYVLYQQRYQNKDRKQDCYICGSYKKRTRRQDIEIYYSFVGKIDLPEA